MDTQAHQHTRRAQWGLLGLALLVLGLLLAASLSYEKQRITVEQFARLSTKARVIDENIVRQLEGVSQTLRSVLNGDDVVLDKGGPERRADPHLSALAEATLGVRTFSVLDPQGTVLASSRPEVVGLNFGSREYVGTVVRSPDAQVLYLSRPFRTVLGVYSMNLTRVATDGAGQVQRIATATLDPTFFAVLLSSVRFDPDVWVSLAHNEGALVMRFPERPELLGSDLRQPGSFFTRHMDSGQIATEFTGRAKATGLPGWMAQRTIAAPSLKLHGALVVAVARDPAAALRSWRQLSLVGAGIWLAIALASAAALWRFQRYQSIENQRLAEADARRQQAEDEVRKLAFFDPLTQLPNRRLLLDRLAQLRAARVRQQRFSGLLFLDLDGFKQLNDTLGHDRGDRLLQAVAQRLQHVVRAEDTAARWGGDEFAVLLCDLGPQADEAQRRLEAVAHKILASLEQPYDLGGLPYQCTCSIGGTLFGAIDEPAEVIFKRADVAMYQAKSSGKDAFRLAPGHAAAPEVSAAGA